MEAVIHWLTFSLEACRFGDLAGSWSSPRNKGGFGRKRSRVHESGAWCYYDDTPRAVVDVAGQVCECWASDWLEQCRHVRGRMTRVDVAVDIGPESDARSRMLSMRRAFQSKRCETDVEAFEEHRSYGVGEGFTWYFGGRQSPLRLRVYDRRGPLRLEFQWRPSDRESMVAACLLDQGPAAIWRALAQKISFPMKWYQDLMCGESADIVPPVRSSDWERTARAIAQQYGATLWALELLGIAPADLQRPVSVGGKGEQLVRFRRWCDQAGERGAKLRAALDGLTINSDRIVLADLLSA